MRTINLKEYNRIHQWNLRHWHKTGVCEFCEQVVKTQWSNISGRYKRNRTDWQELCAKCHRSYDKQVLKVVYGRKTKPRTTNIKVNELRQELKELGIKFDSLENVKNRVKEYSWYS